MATHSIVKVFSPAADVPEVYMYWDGRFWHVSAEGADTIFRFPGPEGLTAASAVFHTDEGSLLRIRIDTPHERFCKALDLWFPHGARPCLVDFIDRCGFSYALAGLGPSRVVRLERWCFQAADSGLEPVRKFDPDTRMGEGPEDSVWPPLQWTEIVAGELYESEVIGGERISFVSSVYPNLKATLVLPGKMCRIVAVAAGAECER